MVALVPMPQGEQNCQYVQLEKLRYLLFATATFKTEEQSVDTFVVNLYP